MEELKIMKKISFAEFRDICYELNPKQFILHSENQVFNFGELGMKFCLKFSDIDFCSHPDIIYLLFDDSCLQIYNIKQIYKCESLIFNNKFNIICSGYINGSYKTVHTLIME